VIIVVITTLSLQQYQATLQRLEEYQMEPLFNVFPRNQSPGVVICLAATRLKAGLNRAFQEAGFKVTTEQWSILSSLRELDGVHQSALAERIAKDRHNVARILALMEKADMVRREPHRKDKRCQTVFLTEKGKRITEELIPVAMDFLGYSLAGVTREDLQNLFRILGHIVENLEGNNDEASATTLACFPESDDAPRDVADANH
jgi:DNA-binding MarR family transcriptional regulator